MKLNRAITKSLPVIHTSRRDLPRENRLLLDAMHSRTPLELT
jgi:hypothetical protein